MEVSHVRMYLIDLSHEQHIKKYWFPAGYLLDKFSRQQHVVIFTFVLCQGIAIALITLTTNIWVFYMLWLFYGIGMAGSLTGGNLCCLKTWAGSNEGGPWMQSIQLAYSVGNAVSSILASPFLSRESHSGKNPTFSEDYGIEALYPIIGTIALTSGVVFLLVGIFSDRSEVYQPRNEPNSSMNNQCATLHLIAFVSVMCTFYFLFCGMEHTMGAYLTTFSMKSELQAGEVDGVHVTETFWSSFAIGRCNLYMSSAIGRGYQTGAYGWDDVGEEDRF